MNQEAVQEAGVRGQEAAEPPRANSVAVAVAMAELAIVYLLERIRKEPELAWHFIGTEAYAKLLRAYSELTGDPLVLVEERFFPIDSFCCRECRRREQEAAEGRGS